MICEIGQEGLIFTALSKTEEYAVKAWIAEGCKIEGIEKLAKTEINLDEDKEIEDVQTKKEEKKFDERETIKKKLDAMGIKYNSRLRLPALKELLEKSIEVPNDKSKSKEIKIVKESNVQLKKDGFLEDDFLNEAVEEKTKIYTVDDVRSSLTAFAKKYGAVDTKTLLSKYNAQKVSDLKADNYQGICEDCEAKL